MPGTFAESLLTLTAAQFAKVVDGNALCWFTAVVVLAVWLAG